MAIILGIDTDKIDEAFINKYLGHYELASGGKINRKLRILARHIAELKESMSEEDFESCTCSKCGGESPGAADECPFCGEADEDDSGNPTVEEPTGEVAEGAEVAGDEGETPTEEEPAEEEPAAKPRSRSAAGKKKAASKKKAPKKKVRARKGRATKPDNTEEAPVEVVEEPSAPLAAVPDNKYSEVDLNQRVAKCRQYMTEASAQCFHLGTELRAISDSNLYLLRTNDNGKQAYTNFKSFCRHEFNLGYKQAYKFMAVAEHYDEDQIRAMGVEKLNLALKVPEDVRQKILDAAEEGETMSTLSDKAAALQGKEPKKAPPKSMAGLTAIIAMGLLEAPAFKAPTKAGKVNQKTTAAKGLKDDPFATFQLENDVEATVQLLTDANGELKFSLAFAKSTEESE